MTTTFTYQRRSVLWRRFLIGGIVTGLSLSAVGCSSAPPPSSRDGLGSQSSGGTGGASGGNAAGGTPAASGRGGIGVTGGAAGGIIPMSGAAGSDTGCAATSEPAKLLPLDLYVMTDSSKSMLKTTLAGTAKWDALKTAMNAFFADPGGEGLSVALKYFPDEEPSAPPVCSADADCGTFGPCDQRRTCVTRGTKVDTVTSLCTLDTDCTSEEVCAPIQECPILPNCVRVFCAAAGDGPACDAGCVPFEGYCRSRDVCTGANYGTPAVPMTAVPAGAQALVDSLNQRMPDGYTPTGPALTGAIQFAQAHQIANPDHEVAIVLVTDGLPGGFIPGSPPPACVPGDVAGVSTLVQMGATGTPPIPVFVIGLFGPCDTDENTKPMENLDLWAAAGGTEKAIMIDTDTDVAQTLKAALAGIRSSAIACRYAIPDVPGVQLDFLKVNVTFTAGMSEPSNLNYVTSAAGCDPTTGGWYYDADPRAGGTPTEIIACEQSCTQFQAAAEANPNAQVGVSYGCPIVEPH